MSFFVAGYFFNCAIICYCLKRPRFNRKAKTLYATQKLFFLTKIWNKNCKTCLFCSRLFFLTAQSFAIVWKGFDSTEKQKLYTQLKNCFSWQKYETRIVKHVFFVAGYFFKLCNHLLLFEKTSIQQKSKNFICNSKIVFLDKIWNKNCKTCVFCSRLFF